MYYSLNAFQWRQFDWRWGVQPYESKGPRNTCLLMRWLSAIGEANRKCLRRLILQYYPHELMEKRSAEHEAKLLLSSDTVVTSEAMGLVNSHWWAFTDV